MIRKTEEEKTRDILFDVVKSLHWLSIPIIYTNKQNRKEKRDSAYPLFSIRYNRRFIKFHIATDPRRRSKFQKRKDSLEVSLIPQFEWINVVKFHQCSAPPRSSKEKERRKKRERKKETKISRYLIPSPLRVIKRPTRLIAGINRYPRRKIDHKIGQWCAIDTIRKWIRGLRDEEPVVLPRPIHSDAVGHSVESGIPGVTHTAPSPRRGDEASSIYKCGSTWLRGRLVSSLLRVRAETVVNPPPPPFSAPSDARESDRLIEISRWIGNWTDA